MADSDIAYAGVARQAELVRSGEVSSRELVELSLERIARHEPTLNAFRVVLAEQALERADELDRDKSAADGAPLRGVPIAIKDDMDLKGQVTAKGTIAHGGPAKVDAKLVRLLREAGAVFVGKTHVPELMTMPFTETTWYGATRNPWDLDRTPGGSSGGSGAAVAAGLVPGATASDGAGSIRIPAGCCGLVGLKPAPGVVPTPLSWGGLSTYGFLSRHTADAALLLDVAAGTGERFASAAAEQPGTLRVAWSIKVPLGVRSSPDATQRRAVESMVETLGGLGHTVERRDPDYGLAGVNIVLRFLAGIAEDAGAMPGKERLGARSRGLARIGAAIPRSQVERARHVADSDRDRIARIFEHADVLLLPLFTSMPPRIGEYDGLGAVRSLDKALAFVPWPGIFNHTGLPAVAVPVERTEDGFPLGVQLVGPPESEGRLLSLAAQLEGAVGWPGRRPAGFE